MLSEFRTRLVEGKAELLLLDTLPQHLQNQGLVKARGRSRTDSTHVLAAVRVLNRFEPVGETLRAALNELATVAPDWLQALAPSVWYERYGRRVENYRLPKTEVARSALAAALHPIFGLQVGRVSGLFELLPIIGPVGWASFSLSRSGWAMCP